MIERINSFIWAGWSINNFCVDADHEKIVIELEKYTVSVEKPEVFASILCDNFIGFSFIGHWDESAVEHLRIEAKGEVINASLRTVKRLYGELPSPVPLPFGEMKTVDSAWYQLNIVLTDGSRLNVACRGFVFKDRMELA